MLKIKKINLRSSVLFDDLSFIFQEFSFDHFCVIPVEGINSKYYNEDFSNVLKVSFIFNKRIFMDDNELIEKNDIFADILLIEKELISWFNNKFSIDKLRIIEKENVFRLFFDCLSEEERDFRKERILISDSAKIHEGVVIGNNVFIGPNTIIYPNVVIYDNVYIGANVKIHSNSVIGADGYGYTEKIEKIPQEGGVVIKDNVEIGACCCVDRATIGYTYVGENTKTDNFVQIGHNVKIGKNCRIVSKSGIAGSARIYDNCIIAAMAGVKDGIRVGPNSILAGASMATKNIPPNTIYAGNPARPFNQYFKELVKK